MKTWSMTAVSAGVNSRRAASTVGATCAVAALSAFVTATAAGQERLKVIYSQFTMTIDQLYAQTR